MDTTWIPWNLVLIAVGALLVGLVAGILVMRRGQGAARVRELKEELEASQQQLAEYRDQVSDHFTRTSDLLRRMTIQYRAVYEHLAEGARSLCPEGAAAIESKIEEPSLPLEARAGDQAEPATPDTAKPAQTADTSERTMLGPDDILDEELPKTERLGASPIGSPSA